MCVLYSINVSVSAMITFATSAPPSSRAPLKHIAPTKAYQILSVTIIIKRIMFDQCTRYDNIIYYFNTFKSKKKKIIIILQQVRLDYCYTFC
jgi:hypothetical protein